MTMASPDQDPGQTARQYFAIQTLIEEGLKQEEILASVRAYNRAAENRFFDLIAAIAAIPSEAVLLAIMQEILDASPRTIVGNRHVSHIHSSMKYNDAKHHEARTLDEVSPYIETPSRQSTDMMSRKRPVVRRRCPGNSCSWACPDRPMDGRRHWQSFKPFSDHFIATHIHSYRTETGAHAICSFCQPPVAFNGDGTLLVHHLWTSHMDPYLSISALPAS
ncbi:hypothetical protein C7974DRAFT_456080 [Boeremia exigua]|uniref:uncharacterized protein n=1 Tax=Boeremia exigua TaxID=749465 RepID=UPI001E8CBFDC|nr:uncharacterized protein C7974DRAFT_456080 [Boeremia exigua]KAH6625779.1 hypothetical protein C7974DRAFT_456080 [Boeremia exigua]